MTGPHEHRVEPTEAEWIELGIKYLEQLQMAPHLIVKAAGEPIGHDGGAYFVIGDRCWCREPRVKSDDIDAPDFRPLHIRHDGVYDLNHDRLYDVRRLFDLLPRGVRKSTKKRRDLIKKTIRNTELLTRCAAFESGDDYGTQSLNVDPVVALSNAGPSKKAPLRGVIVWAKDIATARETLKQKRDSLPWRDDLTDLLRHDRSLPVDWHRARLTLQEERILREQKAETILLKRRARLKVIDRLRREANALASEPL